MLFLLIALLLAILSIAYAISSCRIRGGYRLPPGPVGFPILGCIPYIWSRTAHLTVEKWCHQYGPLISFYMGDTLVVVLGDSSTVREALVRQADIFNGRCRIRAFRANGKSQGIGLSTAEGELWREQRRFCTKVLRDFGAGRSILEPKIRREAEFLCEEIRKRVGWPFDIRPFLHYAVANIIVEFVFARRFDYDDPVYMDYLSAITYRLNHSGVNSFSAFNFLPWLLKFPGQSSAKRVIKDGAKLLAFLQDCIEQKRRKLLADPDHEQTESLDYVSAFFESKASGEGEYFHDNQLLSSVQQLFVAGSETTATTLRWILWFLCRYPAMQERLYDEIRERAIAWVDRSNAPFTQAFICEVERIRTAVPFSVTHRTLEETVLCGYRIPKDSYVIPLAWAVHRDAAQFPQPHHFRPERFLASDGKFVKHDSFMPFGVGPRACLGESLAKMEIFVFLTSLVQQFRFRFSPGVGGDRGESIEPIVGVVISPPPFEMICEERQHSITL